MNSNINLAEGKLEMPRKRDQSAVKTAPSDPKNDNPIPIAHQNPGPSQIFKKIKPLDSDTTSTEPPEEHFVPLNSLPSLQAAFTIPKIRERIFSYFSPPELLQLRLVSRDFRRYATNETLLNWNENVITVARKFFSNLVGSTRRKNFYKFKDLTKLMNGSGSYPFPCRQFEIIHTKWENEGEEFQTFLSTHGSRIEKLSLRLFYQLKCKEISDPNSLCSHKQNWLFQILKNLLLHQATNLVKIKVAFGSLGDERKMKACREYNFSTLTIDRATGVFNTKLRSAKISKNLPSSVFEFICELAPKLTHFECGSLEYYMGPVKRPHLIKELSYYADDQGKSDKNLLIKRIVNTDGKLGLNKLLMDFPIWINISSEVLRDLADIINKLLEKSCDSLRRLEINSTAKNVPGIKFPRMPNVDTICFFGYPQTNGETFFPEDVRFSDTFPKVINLHFYDSYSGNYRRDDTDAFFLLCGEREVVTSVRKIKVDYRLRDLEKYQRWFPNARIVYEISYP